MRSLTSEKIQPTCLSASPFVASMEIERASPGSRDRLKERFVDPHC